LKSTSTFHNNFSVSPAFIVPSQFATVTSTVLDMADVVLIVQSVIGYPLAVQFATTTFVTLKLCVLFAAVLFGI
jgi:hypothetical protein